jgi:hypothetical protein
METGMNRHEKWQIAQDLFNQEFMRLSLQAMLHGVDIDPQNEFSIWDWEFRAGKYLLGLGEYRRRFHRFGHFDDFRFSKKKFDTMKKTAKEFNVTAMMFVQFDDQFLYFTIEGSPNSEMMRRNHEIRTEECVCIPKNWFKNINHLEKELIF